MYDSAQCQAIKELLIPPIQSKNQSLLEQNISTLRKQYPLAFSMLADTLQEANRTLSKSVPIVKQVKLHKLLDTIKINVDSLALWDQTNHRTVNALETGKIRPRLLKPHVRFPAEKYDEFYSGQSDRISERAKGSEAEPSKRAPNDINRNLSHNINHAFRISYAVHLVEVLFGLLAEKNSEHPVRWLDIGCGTGTIVNTVNPKRYGCQNWEITGCDMQEGKIALANQRRLPDRQFFPKEAFALLSEMSTQNTPYDIISMFEFLEHLNDPLDFLEKLAKFQSEFILIASPLAQNIDKAFINKPDRVHLWSFSRDGLEKMLDMAGLEVVYSAETRVGSYIGGLDWLTVVCGNKALMKKRRTNWRNF